MLRLHWPVVGVAVALSLFAVSTALYPGGTTDAADTVGYSWAHNFVCSLFQAQALNGQPNAARNAAIPAMWVMCLCLGVMFWRISRGTASRLHRKAIEIAGPAAMVYAALAVTPMHDLMVTIGFGLALVALLATTHSLHVERRRRLCWWGVGSLAILLVNATIYYGHVGYGALPLLQKMNWAVFLGWMLCVYYTKARPAQPPR